MKRKFRILVGLSCCLALVFAEHLSMPEMQWSTVSTVQVTVRPNVLGYTRPGSRVGFAALNVIANPSYIVTDVPVLAVNQRDHTITVQMTQVEAERLASVPGTLFLCEDALTPPPPPWWRRFLRLRGFSGL